MALADFRAMEQEAMHDRIEAMAMKIAPRVNLYVDCEPEDTPIRGNCMASGDEEFDEQCALDIENELARGNTWAWCAVRIRVELGRLVGSDNLNCCSYESEKQFRDCPYFTDMLHQASYDLAAQIIELQDLTN